MCRLYDKRLPLEPFYPADKPSKGEIVSTDCRLPKKTLRNGARHDISTEALKHAPPGSASGFIKAESSHLAKKRRAGHATMVYQTM